MSAVRRVQRVPESWPTVHLESDPPTWDGLVVDGHVVHARRLGFDELSALGAERRTISLHCVWGWSKPAVAWDGIGFDRVLDIVGATGSHVSIFAASGVYSACLPIDDAAHGFLAWGRDRERLCRDAGGPLRFVPPENYWAYKGVKWAARIQVGSRFVPGFWESRIGDPVGRIPPEVDRP